MCIRDSISEREVMVSTALAGPVASPLLRHFLQLLRELVQAQFFVVRVLGGEDGLLIKESFGFLELLGLVQSFLFVF